MFLNCDKREVMVFSDLGDAVPASFRINRCIWAQVAGRDHILYKVYPGGRIVQHSIKVPWKKGRPETGAVKP